jgi:transcriptional regulator with XRE-family HTH domain
MSIGDRIRQIRNAAALTQRQFAHELQTSRVYITQLERCTRAGSAAFIFSLRRKFNVNPSWWQTGEGAIILTAKEPQPTEIRQKVILTRKELRISQQQLGRRIGY